MFPGSTEIATLANQVIRLQRKFEYCSPRLVESCDVKFAFKFATEAIDSQITLCAETIKAKTFQVPCKICFEDTDIAEMFSIGHCPHKYCLSCMKNHVEVKFQNGMVAQFPHKNCTSNLSIGRSKAPKLVDVMIDRIKESSIPATEKVYCPYPKCSTLMSKEVLESTKTSFVSEGGRKCMKCHLYFCIHCKVPWHYNMTCSDYKRSKTYSRTGDHLLKSLATKKLWRQCSKCNHMVELTSGCYHITCRWFTLVPSNLLLLFFFFLI